jgi:hypothetical protein
VPLNTCNFLHMWQAFLRHFLLQLEHP